MVVRRTLLLMTFILCGYDVITACTCGGRPSPCEAYANASAVFIGIVKRVEPEKPASEEYIGESSVVETSPIRLEAHGDIQNVELRFSFPLCPERERKRQ